MSGSPSTPRRCGSPTVRCSAPRKRWRTFSQCCTPQVVARRNVHDSTMRIALLTLLLALAVAAPAAARGVGVIPSGHTLVVVGQSGVERADAFAAETGFRPAGAMWYLGLHEDAEVASVPADIAKALRTHRGSVVNLGVSFGAIS